MKNKTSGINPTHFFQNCRRGSHRSSQTWKYGLNFTEEYSLVPIAAKLESAGTTSFILSCPGIARLQ